jgi:hypothetical protein
MAALESKSSTLSLTPLMKDAKIGRRTSQWMTTIFLVMLLVPPAHQVVHELRTTQQWRFLRLFQEFPTPVSLKRFEDNLGRESVLAERVRRAYQSLLICVLRRGTEKIVIGRDGFLFFRKEVDFSAGPGFLSRRIGPVRGISTTSDFEKKPSDAIAAILDYQNQLTARGIRLVLMPIPLKPVIYPEKLRPTYPIEAGPAWNRDYPVFVHRLVAAGIDVLDITDPLWRAKSNGPALFLQQDTHWTPAGLQVVVQEIAHHLKPMLAPAAGLMLASKSKSVSYYGDLVRMLETEPKGNPFPKENVEIALVFENDHLVKGGDEAPVLVLGDSFCNVFSRPDLGWGEGAGLGEQLMKALGVHVQVIAQNGGGATGARETLAQKPQALRQKKIVVWTFSSRDLFDEAIRWECVPLPEERP